MGGRGGIFTSVSKLKEKSFLFLVSYLCLLLLGIHVLIDRRSEAVLDPGKLRFLLVSMTIVLQSNQLVVQEEFSVHGS